MNLPPRLAAWLDRCSAGRIVLAAAVIRLVFCAVYVFLARHGMFGALPAVGDNAVGVDGFPQIAQTLLHHGKFAFDADCPPVSYRGPILPLLMALTCAWSPVYWGFLWGAVSVGMSTAVVYFTGNLVQALGCAEERPRKIAMLLAAGYPYLVFSTKTPTTIVLLTLCFTLVALGLLRLLQGQGNPMRLPMLLGLALGLGMLLHGSFLVITAMGLLLLLGLSKEPFARRVRQGIAIGAVAVLVLIPWGVRNARAFGAPLPLLTGAGLQYWLADACYFRGVAGTDEAFEYVRADFARRHGRPLIIRHGGVMPPSDDLLLLAEAKQDLRQHCGNIPLRLWNGIWRFWAPTDCGPRKAVIAGLSNVPLLVAFPWLFFQALRKRRLRKPEFVLLCLAATFYGLFAMLQAISVYFVVIVPSMLALGASFLSSPTAKSTSPT